MADKSTIIRDAQKYLAKGQVDKAIAEWEKLIAAAPDGNTFNIVGDLYLRKGDKKGAVDTYHRAARFFRTEGFSLKALALYKKVLNIQQNDGDALYALGELSEEKGIVTDAIKYFLAAADSLSKEGKKERIQEVYEKILSLSPSNIPLRAKVAEIYVKEGLKTDASKEYITIALLYEEKEDFGKAREALEKAIEVQPLNRNGHIGMSRLLEKTGELDRALKLAKEASVLFPDDVEVLFRGAEISLVANRLDSAKSFLKTIREKDPDNIKARRLLGEILAKEGRKKEAWAEFTPILDALLLDMNYEEAIRFIEPFKEVAPIETSRKLVSLYRQIGEMPSVAAELTTLGNALREEGSEEEAVACFREALEITPDDVYLQQLIAPPEEEKEPEIPEIPAAAAAAEPEDWETEILKTQFGAPEESEAVEKPQPETEPAELTEEQPAELSGGLPDWMVKPGEQFTFGEPEEPEAGKSAPAFGPETAEAQFGTEQPMETEPSTLRQPVFEPEEQKEELPSFEQTTARDLEPTFTEPPVAEEPLFEAPPEPEVHAHEQQAAEHITVKADKPVDEIFTEADIFARYGLVLEAQRLLEGLKLREPHNIELHTRLSSLYKDMNDTESFVTECLILNKLHAQKGDAANAERMLHEARAAAPGDPRLPGGVVEKAPEPQAVPDIAEAREEEVAEDYEEQLSEADFYARQGLIQEAVKILERLHRLYPENSEVIDRMHSIGQTVESGSFEGLREETPAEEASESTFTFIQPAGMTGGELHFEEPAPAEQPFEPASAQEEAPAVEETLPEDIAAATPEDTAAPDDSGFESLSFTDEDLVEAQEMPEPALDNDVLEVFHEFKKGLEKELEKEDSETHYNLGIAYKEMGLVDDAITEFQTAKNDPKRFLQSSTMLGVCYIEKGLYSLAVDVLKKAFAEMKETDEAYWPLTYDLAEAQAKNGQNEEALDLYTKVYGWNARFRNVAERLTEMRTRTIKSGGGPEKPKAPQTPKERKDRVSYL